jgi:hypothetical protein
MNDPTPEEVIRKIAEVAAAFAAQAGVGGMETAGMLISGLATHPEKIAAFLSGELNIVDDDLLLQPAQGCLTRHAQNGKIMSPAERRAISQQYDN